MPSLFFWGDKIACYSERPSWLNYSKEKQEYHVWRGRQNYQRRHTLVERACIQTKADVKNDGRQEYWGS